MVISLNEHSQKASSFKLVTEEGIDIFLNDLQLLKDQKSIYSNDELSSNVTSDNEVQKLKAPREIFTTVDGIVIFFKEEHSSKQLYSNNTTDEGV